MKTNAKPFALLVNDIHVSKDKLQDFHDNWAELQKVAYRHEVKDIIIGGDLWQSRSSQTLASLLDVKERISYMATMYDITIAEGNHDKVDLNSIKGYNHLFDNIEYVTVVDYAHEIEVSEDVSLYVMSYFPENETALQVISEITGRLDKSKKNILYAHEGVKGGLSEPQEKELPTDIFEPFDLVLMGHYHDRKHIPGTNIHYIGASRQHTFGEDSEKGYTILYDDGTTKFVRNEANAKFATINLDYRDVDKSLFDEIDSYKQDGYSNIRVRISCKSNEAKLINKQEIIEHGATKVEVVVNKQEFKLSESKSIDHKFDKDGIKKEYSKFCMDKNIDDKEGLEYLNKIQLCGK